MTDALLTIITPCLDARLYIGDMLASLHEQDQGGVSIEHIVLDGGSTDGTREILSGRRDIRLVAERDAGSHDAMNNGLSLASGEIIGFLNTDDLYAPGILGAVVARFAAEPELDALLGRSYLFAQREAEWEIVEQHPLCRGDGLDLRDLMYGIPCINARFFRRRVFDKIGGFSLDFSFAADRHFLLRLALGGVRGAVMDRPTYFYRRHGQSRTLDASRRNALAFGHEHVAIADALLASSAGPPAARRALRAWRAYEKLATSMRAKQGIRDAGAGSDVVATFRGLTAKLEVRRRGRRESSAAGLPPDLLPRAALAPPGSAVYSAEMKRAQ